MSSFIQVFGSVKRRELLGRDLKATLAKRVELPLSEAKASLVYAGELLDEERTLVVTVDFFDLFAHYDDLRKKVMDSLGAAVKAHLIIYEKPTKEHPWTVKILIRGSGDSNDRCDTLNVPWVE